MQNGSPAQRAGLGSGDVVVGRGGADVDSADTLTDLVVQRHPGDPVSLVWTDRVGQRHTATVTLVEGPPA